MDDNQAILPNGEGIRRRGFDAARSAQEEDHLNRWPLAQEIYRIAANGPREWSVRIGVYGEWGSGKTSVLQFIEAMARKDEHVIFSFNPWQFQTTEALWKGFVEGLFRQIDKATKTTSPGAISRKSKAVGGVMAKILPATLKLWRSEAGEACESGLSLLRKYLLFSEQDLKHLAAILGERRLIVTIDDLDRTDAQLVPEILFAVKEIMDVPGMAFVCAFDPIVVGRVLGSSHPGFDDGLKFLEKIIDYPRWLSEPTASQLSLLATSDAAAICPYVPAAELCEAVVLLPKNPRAIRQFIRLLDLLRPQIERHHPYEINWAILLAANVMKVRFPQLAPDVLSDTIFWENIFESALFGEEKKENRAKAISEKIQAVLSKECFSGQASFADEIERCVSAISQRLSAWHGIGLEALQYQFQLAETPCAVTWREFDTFLERMESTSLSARSAHEWIIEHSDTHGQPDNRIFSELLHAALHRRAGHLGKAADAMPGREMNTELALATKMLKLIDLLMLGMNSSSRSSCVVEVDHLKKLFEQVGQYFQWRRTPSHRTLRKNEASLLKKLFDAVPDEIESWIDIIGLNVWDGRHEDRGPEWIELIKKFRELLKDRCSRWLIQQIPKQTEFMRHVIRHEKHGHRYRELFLDSGGPIWIRHRKLLLKSFHLTQDSILQNNAYELLSWLEYLSKKDGEEAEAANRLLSEADFAIALWKACVSAPLNPRAVGSLRDARNLLVSTGIECKTPAWWDRIVKDLPTKKAS